MVRQIWLEPAAAAAVCDMRQDMRGEYCTTAASVCNKEEQICEEPATAAAVYTEVLQIWEEPAAAAAVCKVRQIWEEPTYYSALAPYLPLSLLVRRNGLNCASLIDEIFLPKITASSCTVAARGQLWVGGGGCLTFMPQTFCARFSGAFGPTPKKPT